MYVHGGVCGVACSVVVMPPVRHSSTPFSSHPHPTPPEPTHPNYSPGGKHLVDHVRGLLCDEPDPNDSLVIPVPPDADGNRHYPVPNRECVPCALSLGWGKGRASDRSIDRSIALTMGFVCLFGWLVGWMAHDRACMRATPTPFHKTNRYAWGQDHVKELIRGDCPSDNLLIMHDNVSTHTHAAGIICLCVCICMCMCVEVYSPPHHRQHPHQRRSPSHHNMALAHAHNRAGPAARRTPPSTTRAGSRRTSAWPTCSRRRR